MNSYRDFTKICRVCMSDGSRDIFHKITPSASPIPSTSSGGTSSLDRLLEKLRYVTMMKIEESDDLPRLICDLCIVQLNVAYNFKRQAVENDTKLRQYFIENGINSACNNSSGSSNTNSNVIFNQQNQNVRNSLTVSNISSMPVNRSFPIVPFIIKTEPSDNDAFSDVTTEINLDANRAERLTPTIPTSTPGREIPSGSIDSGIELFNKDKHNSSVVYINGYGYNSLTPSSDIESIHNNHQLPTINLSPTSNQLLHTESQQQRQRSQERQQSLQQQKQKQQNKNEVTNSTNISVNNSSTENKKKDSLLTATNAKATPKVGGNSSLKRNVKTKKKHLELRNLSISMSLPSGKKRKTVEATTNESIRKTPRSGIRGDIGKKCKPTRAQKQFLVNIGKVTASPTSSLQKSNSSADESSILLLNPFNSNAENGNETRMRKRRLYNEGRVKEKTLTRFIRPKLEPTGK